MQRKQRLHLCWEALCPKNDDRIKKGSVTDYFSINLPFLKRVVFNLGDISIFVGVILLVLGTKEQPR